MKDLQQSLAEWQKALRLQDWDIKAEVMPKYEYESKRDSKYSQAQNAINTHTQSSVIWISEDNNDKENSLVHELSHLLVNDLDRFVDDLIDTVVGEKEKELVKCGYYRELEKAVSAIARALVNVRDMAQ